MNYKGLSKEELLARLSELLSEVTAILYSENRYDIASKIEKCQLLLEKLNGNVVCEEQK